MSKEANEQVKFTDEERLQIKKDIWNKFNKIKKVEDVSYIKNGNGRRRFVFKTPFSNTIVTMEEPSGSISRKHIAARDKEEMDDFSIGIKWVVKLEYVDGNTALNGLEIIDPSNSAGPAITTDAISKEILEWGIEEAQSIADAFFYMNKTMFLSDFYLNE